MPGADLVGLRGILRALANRDVAECPRDVGDSDRQGVLEPHWSTSWLTQLKRL